MKLFQHITVALFVTALIASAEITGPVQLDTGLISGGTGAVPGIRVFRGIPYAAPPIGDLRWRPPQPPASWEGVRAGDQFAAMCLQGTGGPQMSEDCLYLNIWTAAESAAARLPVMVWSHGGGNYVGSGGGPQYDGALAKKGVVVVTVNFRIGPLGFFAHPELTRESGRQASGNYGLMDQIAALQWVQRNIAAFGGDPDRVTIFGESAGAQDVANLMASPRAKGLFHRALGESSSWTTVTVRPMQTLAEAEQAGVAFAASVGANSLADLRSKDAVELVKAGRGTSVIIDGWVVPEDPGVTFAKGAQNDVPLLVGSNRDEGNFFITEFATAEEFRAQARARFGDLADRFLEIYPARNDEEAAASDLASRSYEVRWVMRNWARLHSKTGTSNAYHYFFTHEPPAEGNTRNGRNQGVSHTVEIVYVYQSLAGNRPWTDLDRQVSDTMASYWANFAATGDPNGAGLPRWQAFDEGSNLGPMVLGDVAGQGGSPDDAVKLKFYKDFYDRLQSR